jgi:hypothetical protein
VQRIGTPADAKNVLSLGAVAACAVATDCAVASFSARGPTADGRIKPDVCATGSSVIVADTMGGYKRSSGTSFATPHAAGVAALVMQAHPDWTNLEVREALLKTATRATSPGVEYGWGIIQGLAAIQYDPRSQCSTRCQSGACVDGHCICKQGFYNLYCDQGPISCTSWCKFQCAVDGTCVCPSGTRNSRCASDCSLRLLITGLAVLAYRI